MVAREVPTSSTMAVPHGPASVGVARRRLRRDLGERQIPDTVVDDAVLILSELLSNACRYARPLGRLLDLGRDTEAELVDQVLVAVPSRQPAGGQVNGFPASGPRGRGPGDGESAEEPGGVLVRWGLHPDGMLTLEVTDGGAPTRPIPSSPSLTSRGGRGLSIVGQLASDWGVRDLPDEVTVWAALPVRGRHARRGGSDARSA
ncbi:ATP-binding protein [Kitasatospora sp. NBC_00240]|uniref:ATP-binding protein n=1 Tax=Kitasatospora sp. NBC_00240 TaxID=2903567 RepID=UPI0022593C34|nr:ATP-binding protein [Kitasatospora sp. NBC_00240]MCX5211893.1 ATP-binding protein [Kitasatospora sp. NBC_00240]